MSKKLGLVKDLGTAFGKGMFHNIVTNIGLATAGNAVVRHLTDQEFDLEESLKMGLVVGAGLMVVNGVVNTIGQAGVIKENYGIRKANDESTEIVATFEEIED